MPYNEWRDPTQDLRTPAQECSSCGCDIYPGEIVFHLMGEYFCRECVNNAKERVR